MTESKQLQTSWSHGTGTESLLVVGVGCGEGVLLPGHLKAWLVSAFAPRRIEVGRVEKTG
jgi:hypothetical protein